MPLSDYVREKLIAQLADLSDWNGPGDTYVGLFTSGPPSFGNANEVTNSEYERQLIGWKTDGSVLENPGSVTFPEADTSWGTVTHFAAFDSKTGGNQLFSGKLKEDLSVAAGDIPTIPAKGMPVYFTEKQIRTVYEWGNLPSYAAHGDIVVVEGDLDTYHFQYDTNLSSSKLGEEGWRLIYSLTEEPRFRKIPIGDGNGNLHPMWDPQQNNGVTFSPNKATVNLADDGSYQSLLVYSNFYLPIKPVARGVLNFGGLTPGDMGGTGGVGIRFGIDDQLEDTTVDDWSGHVIVRGSYAETISRFYMTSGNNSDGGGMVNEGADHLVEVEGQHEIGSTEWGRYRDLSTNNDVEVHESTPRFDRMLGGRIYFEIGEFLSPDDPATYSITPPDIYMRDIEVYC